MAGTFELKNTKGGEYRFVLKAGNGEVILTSESYKARTGAVNGIASVKKNAPLDERYARKTAKNGQAYFVLRAGNYQVVGTSEMYTTEQAREKGIASVKATGPGASTTSLLAKSAAK